jgi:5-methylcytosine-specific restriction protein B
VNRADMAKVFGELIFALEYRGEPVITPYEVHGTREIVVPANVYIIGTMNTADKSIAMLDYALRRRFGFYPLYPDPRVIEKYYNGDEYLDTREQAKALFRAVEACFGDTAKDLQVGHTYFLVGDKQEGNDEDIFEPYSENHEPANRLSPDRATELLRLKFIYEISPLLREYVQAAEEGIYAPAITEAYSEPQNVVDRLTELFGECLSNERRLIQKKERTEPTEGTE